MLTRAPFRATMRSPLVDADALSGALSLCFPGPLRRTWADSNPAHRRQPGGARTQGPFAFRPPADARPARSEHALGSGHTAQRPAAVPPVRAVGRLSERPRMPARQVVRQTGRRMQSLPHGRAGQMPGEGRQPDGYSPLGSLWQRIIEQAPEAPKE